MKKHPIATIEMSSGKNIVIELYPEEAPNTCASFIWLANRGRYDNKTVDRIVPGFVIQPSYSEFDHEECKYEIDGEFLSNGFPNHLKNDVGCIAMGGDGKSRASGCEFYFTLAYHERLDGNYPVFGKVIEGWDEVERLEHVELVNVPCSHPGIEINRPVTPETMVRVRVETFGESYPEPVKLSKQAAGGENK